MLNHILPQHTYSAQGHTGGRLLDKCMHRMWPDTSMQHNADLLPNIEAPRQQLGHFMPRSHVAFIGCPDWWQSSSTGMELYGVAAVQCW
jgi:hypothetical protein